VDDVRKAGRALAGFSSDFAVEERRLKAFMYERLYYHPVQVATAERAHEVIARLFTAYSQDPSLMSDGWSSAHPNTEPGRSRHIADFIAGMTDRFAIDQYAKIFGKVPEGLSNV
jgi:dGTPase